MEIEFDYEDEREKEIDTMQLNVDGIILEIPEEILAEMEQILHFDTREKMIEEITVSAQALKDCFTKKELEEKSFNERLIDYLRSEMKFFK